MANITKEFIEDYMRLLRTEFPALTIDREKPWWLSFIFSLPGIKKLEWNNATQTIGMNIWLSERWDEISPVYQLSTLRHERQHLIWFQRHTTILASLLYLFCIFPIGLAYYRALFERAGYYESLRTRVEYFGSSSVVKASARSMYLRTFTGWKYFKMWPYKKMILRWFNEDWEKAVRLYSK